MQELTAYCDDLARRARAASHVLAAATGARKNHWLEQAAAAIDARAAEILQANTKDVAEAARIGLTAAQVDRLQPES